MKSVLSLRGLIFFHGGGNALDQRMQQVGEQRAFAGLDDDFSGHAGGICVCRVLSCLPG